MDGPVSMPWSIPGPTFGKHIRGLRCCRGLTQELLAERCALSTDTIRRLEYGSFSPSLATLCKLCAGLQLRLSTLFESFELGTRDLGRELLDLLAPRSERELEIVIAVVRALLAQFDTPEPADPTSEPPSD